MYECEELLQPYAVTLSEFGRKNGFRQERYRHDTAVWTLFVPLANNQNGRVQLGVSYKKEVFLSIYWPSQRNVLLEESHEMREIKNPQVNLEAELQCAVDELRNRKA